MLENLESVAFDLALRSLGQQEQVLGELRARTGTLLTATAVTSSFLGARALTGNAEHALGIVGFAFAIVSIVLSVYVLAPKGAFDFAISGAAVYDYFASDDVPVIEAKRTLAYWAPGRLECKPNRHRWAGFVVSARLRCSRPRCRAMVACAGDTLKSMPKPVPPPPPPPGIFLPETRAGSNGIVKK